MCTFSFDKINMGIMQYIIKHFSTHYQQMAMISASLWWFIDNCKFMTLYSVQLYNVHTYRGTDFVTFESNFVMIGCLQSRLEALFRLIFMHGKII